MQPPRKPYIPQYLIKIKITLTTSPSPVQNIHTYKPPLDTYQSFADGRATLTKTNEGIQGAKTLEETSATTFNRQPEKSL